MGQLLAVHFLAMKLKFQSFQRAAREGNCKSNATQTYSISDSRHLSLYRSICSKTSYPDLQAYVPASWKPVLLQSRRSMPGIHGTINPAATARHALPWRLSDVNVKKIDTHLL